MDILESGNETLGSIDLDAALRRAIRGGPKIVDAHLRAVEKDLVVGNTKTSLHCYCLPLDGNGRVRFKPLAEFLRDRILDYAIPRKTIEQAKQQFINTGSSAAIVKLEARAKSLFTHLASTGEGGELMLFAMAEAVFGLTQIICKMSLKTSTSMHYHGADGVYANVRESGGLNLYWGESKIYSDVASAIRECLASLAPFLTQPDGEGAQREQDILLINEFANFDDEAIVDGLRQYLDRDNSESLMVEHRGIALIAFDAEAYDSSTNKTIEAIELELRKQIPKWSANVAGRLSHEQLSALDIHFICVPLPSAKEFRAYFLELLGVKDED